MNEGLYLVCVFRTLRELTIVIFVQCIPVPIMENYTIVEGVTIATPIEF